MTYPQQPDEESSEDTQSIQRQQAQQEDPVSPFGPAPQPVDPFAPPSYGPPQPQQYQQPAQPQYQQPQHTQYPQQPPANPAEPPTVPNQWGPQQPQVYVPQNPPVYTPEQPPYQPPVSAPPAYTPPPVSAPPHQQVSAPPVYTPPVSGPPAYTPPPVSAPPHQQVSGPPAYTPPPVSGPPSPQVSGPPAYQPPVSGPPAFTQQPVSGPPVYVPPVSLPPAQQYHSGPDPQVFASKPVVSEGPTFTGTQPDPALWGGAPVPGPRKGIPKAVVIVSVAIVVIALGVGAVLFFNAGGGTPSADPSTSASQDPNASGPPVIALNPITNEQTRLEYLTPGDWTALSTAPAAFNELIGAVGELKEGASLPALFLNGGLDTALVPYAGPAQITAAAEDLAVTLDGGRYVGADGGALKGLKREAAPTVQQARIDGRVAVILRYHVVWEDPAKAAGGDTVTVVLIDIDGSRAASVYSAVPDDMPDSVKSVEDRLATLHFNM